MKRQHLFARSFWAVIGLLAVIVIGLSVLAAMRDHPVVARIIPPAPREIPQSRIEAMIRDAGEAAYQAQAARLDQLLAAAYAPVYAGIPSYAEFHYSVLGEYTELGSAALGQMGDAMESRLFPDLAAGLGKVADDLDAGFLASFTARLDQQIQTELQGAGAGIALGDVTRSIQQDAINRVAITAPVAVAMTVAAKPAIKAVAATMAKKMATKVASKAAAKGAVKATGIGGGAATGAAVCSPGGPIASVICGAGAAAVIWFGADAAIVNIDEYFNRDDFETELHGMIDQNHAEVKARLLAMLNEKRVATEDFTFSQAASGD
ncbi:hypothetical protein [Paracoccus aestuariivivens]|uniref:Uncharacterized protein n=1 Tax=Paracoccus aestuariivivens TaxID=1820333 RepID=A0A6L6J4R7_9RHOB|nr:hypothetical protein [Paracoccus aestuariivivens]MTH76225.1 hypothetical protein [Paracoccus aestuariivivens]